MSLRPVFLITGASSGFGEAIAHEALSRGHHVIATARNAAKLSALRSAGATVFDLDVTSDDATLADIFAKAHAVHGRITHVVNCAGYLLEGTVEEARYALSLFPLLCSSSFLLPSGRAEADDGMSKVPRKCSTSSTPTCSGHATSPGLRRRTCARRPGRRGRRRRWRLLAL
ncbi:hypothetical protein VTG60DRAFT_3656 [Thermothelomyces hinnuleus]